jgi:2TM domain
MSGPQPDAGDGETVTPTAPQAPVGGASRIPPFQIAHREDVIMSSDVLSPQPEPEPPQLRSEAQRWVRRLRILYTILGIYAVLSLMWFAIDMADGTENLWLYWPMLGTGLAVAITAVVLVGIGGLFGTDRENRKVQRYLQQHEWQQDQP